MRLILTIVSITLFFSVISQRITDMPPFMEKHLSGIDDSYLLNMFISAPNGAIENFKNQGLLKHCSQVQGYHLVQIEYADLKSIVSSGQLTYLETLIYDGRPLNDEMVLNNNIHAVHQGVFPIDVPLDGSNVVVGMIDTGIELVHPDFLDQNNASRVLDLWDMTIEVDPQYIPDEYGFGSVWTADQIDAGEAFLHTDQNQWFGHGSTVTGTACSDGSAVNNYMGAAPASDMAIVSFDFDRPDFLPTVAQAVEYIYNSADDEGAACVINASLGTYFGSHDGLDPTALYIDSLMEAQPGRLFVAAAGNSQTASPYHLRTELLSDTAFTWFEAENGLGDSGAGVFFELWSDTQDLINLNFTIAVDSVTDSSWVNKAIGQSITIGDVTGSVLTDSLWNSSGTLEAVVQYWGQIRGDQFQLQIYLPFVNEAADFFRFESRGTGNFDVWSTSVFGTSDIVQEEIPTTDDFSLMSKYVLPDNNQHMVSSWACSDQVVTVANYVNRTSYIDVNGNLQDLSLDVGNIYISSSAGPSRTGLLKPDISATGSITLSTGDFSILQTLTNNEPHKVAQGGMHFRNGGTSMASPVVSGIGALFLEQCPYAYWSTFVNAVHNAGTVDIPTGDVPNNRWGYGKIDAYATISTVSAFADVELQDGVYTVSANDSYQWFVDGEPIAGETSMTFEPQVDGVYQVEVINEHGCVKRSEPLVFTDIEETTFSGVRVHPNPTSESLFITGCFEDDLVKLYDEDGGIVKTSISSGVQTELNVSSLSSGLYTLVLIRSGRRLVEKIQIR